MSEFSDFPGPFKIIEDFKEHLFMLYHVLLGVKTEKSFKYLLIHLETKANSLHVNINNINSLLKT